MRKCCQTSENGFSLIELSIVLIIISLLIASVIGAQTLIKNTRIRAAINQWSDWEISVNAYKLVYNRLPGDINDNGKIGYVQDGVAYSATGDVCTACGHYTGDYADKTIGTIAGPWVDLYLAKLSNFEPDSNASILNSVWYPTKAYIDVIVPKSKLGKQLVPYFNFNNRIAINNRNVDSNLTAELFSEIDKKIDNGLWDSGTIQSECPGAGSMTDKTYDTYISQNTYCWTIDYYFKF